MTNTPRRQCEIRADRIASLQKAALVTVAKYDIEGATVARICAEAGASRGLISHYFASKEALLVAALNGLFDEAQARKEAIAADSSLAACERIIAIAQSSFQAPIYSWEMAAAWQAFSNACRYKPIYLAPIQRSTERFSSTVAPLFEQLASQGRLSIPAIQATQALFIQIDGLWNSLASGKDHFSCETAATLCEQLVRSCLKDPPT